MEKQICLDEETLTFDGSGDVEVDYYVGDFVMNTDGLGLQNAPGQMISFTPTIKFGGVAMTMGASTVSGEFSSMSSAFIDPGLGNRAIYCRHFFVDLVIGAGFSTPAGELSIADGPVAGGSATFGEFCSINGTANMVDANSTDSIRYLILDSAEMYLRAETGTRATNTSPFTWAVGDELHVSGCVLYPGSYLSPPF